MKPSHCWKERTSSDAVTTCSMVGRGRPWIRNTQALRYMWHTRSRVDGWKAGGSSGGRSRRGNVAKLVAPEPWDLDVWLAMRSSAFDLRFRVRRDGVLLARGHAPRHVLIMCSSWHTPGSRPCATSCAQPPPSAHGLRGECESRRLENFCDTSNLSAREASLAPAASRHALLAWSMDSKSACKDAAHYASCEGRSQIGCFAASAV